MAPRNSPPFRAEQVGSLLRPKKLLEARKKYDQRQISLEELREIEDREIRAAVRRQEQIGLQCVTDGEFRRENWHMDFLCRLGGVQAGEMQLRPFKNECGEIPNEIALPKVRDRVHLRDTIFGKDFEFLKSISNAVPKLTIPSPNILHALGALEDSDAYSDTDEVLDDLVKVYIDLVGRLFALGCTYLQIDDTMFASLGDPAFQDQIRQKGDEPSDRHQRYIKAINDIVAEKPSGMTICIHTCRGNHRSGWVAAGSYDSVAEAVFSQLNVDGLFLEYDDARSGSFEPLRFLPKDRLVVLGLVTTKRGELESKDELKRRIDDAAKYVDLEQICLSPQCGFASTSQGNLLTEEEQFLKLELVVQTANEVWG